MSALTVRESPVAATATPASATPPSPSPQTTSGPSPFARLLHGLGREVQHGESLVNAAVGGADTSTLDAGQLIALQVGVYRYSEAIDLASRLVDHATTGLKTVLQGQ
jgi:hypothetical protein